MKVNFQFNKNSVAATLGNLSSVRKALASTLATKAAGEVLEAAVRRNISLTDHSLADLARMDHPYARRHGKIRIHQSKPYMVHSQSGQMLSALRGSMFTDGGKIGYEVGFNKQKAPHIDYVLLGTSKMLGRNVIEETAYEPGVKKDMMRAAVRVLGKELRTKSSIRFT